MKKMNSSPATGAGGAAGNATQSVALSSQLHQVAIALQDILGGRSGSAVMENVPAALRPGVQALLFQVLRQLGWAQAIRRQLAPRTPRPPVDALLCAALALLADTENPPYEAFTLVNQTIEAAKNNSAERAQAAFINACLRRFLREREALQQANNTQAPMVLRINKRKSTVAQYLRALEAIDIRAFQVGEAGLVLERAVPVHVLPGFADGVVSVQDAAAQLAAPLLLSGLAVAKDFSAPLRVLDACAAPGGKTAHLLESLAPEAAVQITALDIDPARCARIDDTLQRLGLKLPQQVQVLAADAGRPQDWWPQHCASQLFDAILLAAPCTASGIVRRHPDVRWLRRETDIAQLAQIQARLLATLWPLLRPGGRLLYCTCSVFLAEGEQQIKAFLARHSDAVLLPSAGHLWPGQATNAGKADSVSDNLRGEHDGFFYALLHKSAT